MKIKEMRDLGSEELTRRRDALKEELFRFRMQHGANQLESTAMLKKTRRDIARINTVLKQREISRHGI